MIVSEIRKARNNVEVKFNNQEQLIIPYELFLKNYLSKDDELSEEKIEELKDKIENYKITQSALRYLSGRNHSKYELKIKLRKKQFNIEKIKYVIENLEQQKLLNDEVFANYFYQVQLRRKRGALKIKSDLYKKGISRNIIEKIIRENSENEENIKNAKLLAQKKILSLQRKNLSEIQIKQKVYQFLSTRGFTSDVIMKTLNIEELD